MNCAVCGRPMTHYRLYGYKCDNPEHHGAEMPDGIVQVLRGYPAVDVPALNPDPRLDTHKYSVGVAGAPMPDDHYYTTLESAEAGLLELSEREPETVYALWDNNSGEVLQLMLDSVSYH